MDGDSPCQGGINERCLLLFQPIIKKLGQQTYLETWEAMRTMTLERDTFVQDEIWVLEHPPLFTQGKTGRTEHILDTHGIPVIWSDRGGQVTYHGPGQIVVYLLLNLHRLNLGIRTLVTYIEQSIVKALGTFSIHASTRSDAPGVYVNESKIASIGLRVRKGFTYHGFAFNFKMDLTPFSYIDPCGYKSMKITQLYDLLKDKLPPQVELETHILSFLINALGQKYKFSLPNKIHEC